MRKYLLMACKIMFSFIIGIFVGHKISFFLITRNNCETSMVKQNCALPSVKNKMDNVVENTSFVPEFNNLHDKVRILCWVLTHPGNHYVRVVHIKATWGKRCNKILYMSSEEDLSIPTIAISKLNGRQYSWGKTRDAFLYIYEHHRNDADWFIRTDDDTFLVLENLRYMLSGYDTREPLQFGCRFKPYNSDGFMAGGPGVVLSREALSRLYHGVTHKKLCHLGDVGEDDVELGICLAKLGVISKDTRDWLGRGRFLPLAPFELINIKKDITYWYWNYTYFPAQEGQNCCSDIVISFHYIKPEEMYVYDYLIYRVIAMGYSKSYNGITMLSPSDLSFANKSL